MNARRVVAIAAALIVLLVGALFLAAALIPEDRVGRAVASRAETMLGQPVEIGGGGIRILPRPAVRLTGVRVGAADTTAVALLDGLLVRPRLLPLLRGQVLVDRLELDRPQVRVVFDATGASNLPGLFGDPEDAPADPDADARRARDIAFAIDGIRVTDGSLAYRDDRSGTAVRLEGWNQELRLAGELREGELARVSLRGHVAFDTIDARLPDVVLPTRGLSARLDHDAVLDRTADRLTLESLELDVGGVTLAGRGVLEAVSDPERRTARLALEADGLDVEELLVWLPASARERLALPDGTPLDVTGRAALDLNVNGPLTAGSVPPFRGTLRAEGVGVAARGDALVSGVDVDAAFSADSATGQVVGRAFERPLRLTFRLRDPAAPAVAGSVAGGLSLSRLAALGLVADTLVQAGDVRADLHFAIPLATPERGRVDGTVELEDVRARAGFDLAVPAGVLTFEGDALRIDPLPLRLGEAGAPVDIEATVRGWIPAAFDSTAPPPVATVRVRGGELDLDALLGPSESTYAPLLFARLRGTPLEDGRSVEAAARDAELRLPDLPPVDANVHATIAALTWNSTTYRDIDVRARVTSGAIDVTSARLSLMGGTVEGHGRYETTRRDVDGTPIEARVTGEYGLADVAAARFFERFTPLRDQVAGELALAGAFALTLDSMMLPEPSALRAGGTMAVADAQLASWPVLRALADRLGLPVRDTVWFRDWAGRFDVTGTLVALEETVLEGDDLSLQAAGSFDLTGPVDFGATALLSAETAARAGSIATRIADVAGRDGRVPIGVHVGGTLAQPTIQLDLSEAGANAVARARETARREAEDAARRAASEALQRLDLPDSLAGLSSDSLRKVVGDSVASLLPDSIPGLPAAGDSLRSQAEEALRSRLRGLLPGGGGGGGDGGG